MNIQLLSDLHMENFRYDDLGRGKVLVHPQIDVVVLAGDIDSGEYSLRFAHQLAMDFGKPVVWVPGNHEFYGYDYLTLLDKYRNSDVSGVHMLLDSSVVIDGVRFVGSTLWTDFKLYVPSIRVPNEEISMCAGEGSICDFSRIKYGENPFFAKTSAEVHAQSRQYIEDTLDTPFEGKTVVVTHHAPHPKSIHIKYSAGERVLNTNHKIPGENPHWRANPCFASDLTPIVKKANMWLHGHVHTSFDYMVGDCRVIANPRGYADIYENKIIFENQEFKDICWIELE